MARRLGVGILAAAFALAGCGGMLATTSLEPMETLENPQIAPGELPSEALLGQVYRPSRGGLAYMWVGYNGSAAGIGDLREMGSGDGFSLGVGFQIGKTARSSVELGYEKTLKHDATVALTGFVGPSTGAYERTVIGGKSAALPRARRENQPRVYVGYGLAQNSFVAKTTGGQQYSVSGLGYYLGLGVEFPSGERAAFTFDTKYHFWNATDSRDIAGNYAALVYSVLWLNSF